MTSKGCESVRVRAALGDEDPATAAPTGSLAERLEAFERDELRRALAAAGGNVAAAARELGVDRGNLHRRLKRLDIEP